MFKLLKKWWNEWCATQEEMRDAGIIMPQPWVGIGCYYDPSLTAYINTQHDKFNPISKNNRNPKRTKQV